MEAAAHTVGLESQTDQVGGLKVIESLLARDRHIFDSSNSTARRTGRDRFLGAAKKEDAAREKCTSLRARQIGRGGNATEQNEEIDKRPDETFSIFDCHCRRAFVQQPTFEMQKPAGGRRNPPDAPAYPT
jgi:hypothetical protein